MYIYLRLCPIYIFALNTVHGIIFNCLQDWKASVRRFTPDQRRIYEVRTSRYVWVNKYKWFFFSSFCVQKKKKKTKKVNTLNLTWYRRKNIFSFWRKCMLAQNWGEALRYFFFFPALFLHHWFLCTEKKKIK